MKLFLTLIGAAAILVPSACTSTDEDALTTALPEPSLKGAVSIEEALATRRSVRRYDTRALSQKDLGQLLWAAQGITQKTRGFRTNPSAGALYPLEIYVFLGDGVHHYSPQDHAITRVKEGNQRDALAKAALGQAWVRNNGAVILVAADYARTTRKYGDRAKMYVDMEVGCVCQSLMLQGVALGIGSVPVGAFRDADVKRLAALPDEQTPLLLMPVGYMPEE